MACVSPSYWRPILRANVHFFFEALFGTCVLSIMGSLRGAQDCLRLALPGCCFLGYSGISIRLCFVFVLKFMTLCGLAKFAGGFGQPFREWRSFDVSGGHADDRYFDLVSLLLMMTSEAGTDRNAQSR